MNFKRIICSRRSFTALYSVTALTVIALVNKIDTSMAIATIAAAVCAANSYQKSKQPNEQSKLTD